MKSKLSVLSVLSVLLVLFSGSPASAQEVKKITQLPATSSLAGGDLLLTVTNPSGSAATKKITLANFKGSLFALTGTLPDAWFPATLPAINGSLLISLNASSLASGTVPAARLGSGTANSNTFLRGDNTWQTITGSGVDSVFGRTGAVAAATNDYTWAQINKATSSLADITTRSASDLSSGTVPDARFPATLPAASGINLSSLNASNLGSGTIPGARFPATINGLTFAPASVGFTIAGGTTSKTLTVNNTLGLSGTDASTLNIGAGGTLGSNAFTSTAFATAARSINTTAPITGGGDLSADRTIDCATCTTNAASLISDSLVLGAGTNATKVVAGITTNGAAQLVLGVNTTSLGSVKLFGNTSGDATIQPPAIAGTATVVTLPNASSTLPIFGQQITFTGPTAARSIALPDAAFTVARTDAGQTFTGTQGFGAVTASGTIVQTSASSAAFESGPNGSTNPVLRLVNNTASQADGVSITGLAAGNGTTFTALSSGSNSGFTFTPKGTGSLSLNGPVVFAHNLLNGVGAGLNFRLSGGGAGIMMRSTSKVLISDSIAGDASFTVGLGSAGVFFGTGTIDTYDSGVARNGAGVVEINNGTAGTFGGLKAGVTTLSPVARSSGVASYFTVNIPADTAQTAATESIGYQHVTAIRQWASTGTVALQRENFFAGPTYSSASASQTFTDAFTFYATPPVQGTNAIFTRGHTLGIVDSTSAASPITGGFVVSTTLGTTATSVGIGGGNINAGGNGTFGGTLSVTGHATLEGVTSTGATGTGKFLFDGTPTIISPIISTGLTASGSAANTFAGSTGTFLTSTGAVTIGPGAVGVTGVTTLTPPVRSSGVASYFTLNIPADTSQTAATESIGYQHVTATRQWATTGTVALQRENFFAGPTYSSASASQTFTDAFTFYATPPVQGTNAIFTRGHTFGIVDSTSAASSITGGLVVAATLGTTATSVGIGGGNINAGGNGTFGGTLNAGGAKWNVNSSGLPTLSNNLTLAGQGYPVILGLTSQKAETASADTNVLTVTPAAAVGTYRVCTAISVASATSGVISWTLSWTDSQGNAQANIAQQLFQMGTAAPNTTFTTSAAGNYYGCSVVDVNTAAANIIVKWVGGGTSSAKMSATVERIN